MWLGLNELGAEPVLPNGGYYTVIQANRSARLCCGSSLEAPRGAMRPSPLRRVEQNDCWIWHELFGSCSIERPGQTCPACGCYWQPRKYPACSRRMDGLLSVQ